MAVYFQNSAWVCRNISVPSTCSWEFPMLCGYSPELRSGTNENNIYALYSSAVIVSARWPCRPPLRFNATDDVFPLTNRCRSISPSCVNSPSIFIRIGVRKSARTLSTLLIAPAILSHTLVGIDGGFFPWYNLSNLLKSRYIPTRSHCSVDLNGWLYEFMSTIGCYD